MHLVREEGEGGTRGINDGPVSVLAASVRTHSMSRLHTTQASHLHVMGELQHRWGSGNGVSPQV